MASSAVVAAVVVAVVVVVVVVVVAFGWRRHAWWRGIRRHAHREAAAILDASHWSANRQTLPLLLSP